MATEQKEIMPEKRSDQVKKSHFYLLTTKFQTTYTKFINSHPDISVEGC